MPSADAGRMRQALLELLLETGRATSDPAERGRARLAGPGAAVRGLRRMAHREDRSAQGRPEHQPAPRVLPADGEEVGRHPRVQRATRTLRGRRTALAPASGALDGNGRIGGRRRRHARGRLRTPAYRSDPEPAARRLAGGCHPRRVPRNAARTRQGREVHAPLGAAGRCHRPPGSSRWRQLVEACRPINE